MNFKPTLWKVVVSILIFIVVDVFLAGSAFAWYTYIFNFQVLIRSLACGIIVYLIWSLFQKNS